MMSIMTRYGYRRRYTSSEASDDESDDDLDVSDVETSEIFAKSFVTCVTHLKVVRCSQPFLNVALRSLKETAGHEPTYTAGPSERNCSSKKNSNKFEFEI